MAINIILAAITGMILYATFAYMAGFTPSLYGLATTAGSIVFLLILFVAFSLCLIYICLSKFCDGFIKPLGEWLDKPRRDKNGKK